jgi:protein-S-isoprenylcysteine O-methyltransferase Ste14
VVVQAAANAQRLGARNRIRKVGLKVYRNSMRSPIWNAVIQGAFGLLVFIALVFGTAGTWNYWQGWMFMAVFALSTTGFTVYMVLYDRALLERRLAAGPWHEEEWAQRIIVSLVIVSFFGFIVLPIVDRRFGWSPVSAWVSIVGNFIIVLSFLSIFWVIKHNSWAASNVRVEVGQKVVDRGPYAYVRHPMYAGAIWLFVGIPLALGSWWTIVLLVPVLPILLWRLLDEERILRRDLSGYSDYMQRVRYRLVPHVW